MSALGSKKFGLIGAGNMGSAIIAGLAKKNLVDNISIIDTDKQRESELKKKFNINSHESIESLVSSSDIILIAVKPNDIEQVLKKFGKLNKKKIVLSIAAGISLGKIEGILGSENKIVRIMPNTPALINEGMSVLSPNSSVDQTSLEIVKEIFSQVGKVQVLPEKLMDAVTGLSGSGPAYVFTFIQSLTDGGVKMGIPREKALELAAQTVLGAAKMVLSSGEEPMALRNKVTSPGGTTIEGIHAMEKAGFSGIVMSAVEAATEKSKKLG